MSPTPHRDAPELDAADRWLAVRPGCGLTLLLLSVIGIALSFALDKNLQADLFGTIGLLASFALGVTLLVYERRHRARLRRVLDSALEIFRDEGSVPTIRISEAAGLDRLIVIRLLRHAQRVGLFPDHIPVN